MPFRSRTRVLVLIAGLTMAGPTMTAPAIADDAKRPPIPWDQSFNTGDMDTPTSLYGADAEVVTGGAPLSGGPGSQTSFTDLGIEGFADHTVTVQSAETNGDLLTASGRWEASGPGDGGARKVFSGHRVNIPERLGNAWCGVLPTWNSRTSS